jgi:hypothetical protein
MPLTLTNGHRQALCTASIARVDQGSANAAGRVVLQTAGGSDLCTINLNNPAFGAASVSGSASAAGLPVSGSPGAGGTASRYLVQNRDGTELWRGTVTISGSGGDMLISSTTIVEGIDVQILSWTHSMPAG